MMEGRVVWRLSQESLRSKAKVHRTCQRVAITPTDGPAEDDGIWELEEDSLILISKANGIEEQLAIAAVEEDRLVTKKDH